MSIIDMDKRSEGQIIWPLRPVITSLNGDNSWLLSLPRPESDNHTRLYYHLVFEPWLTGPANQFSPWLVHIVLPKPAHVSDIEALNKVALDIEASAKTIAEANGVTKPPPENDTKSQQDYDGPIDAILLFFHYLDHCHEPSLRLFDPRIPVIASPEAKALVEKMDHFTTVDFIPNIESTSTSSTWLSPSLHPQSFPPWLTALKYPSTHHELNFTAAVIWTHESSGTTIHESILYTPHGLPPTSHSSSSSSTKPPPQPSNPSHPTNPSTTPLALLHPLTDSWQLGLGQTSFGAQSGLALYRELRGGYWVSTHSSEKTYLGLLLRALWVTETRRSVEWALEVEEEGKGGRDGEERGRPNLVEVGNGERLVLV